MEKIDYIVSVVDNKGVLLEENVVTSDKCSGDICSISLPLATCLVQVRATSLFENSTTSSVVVGKMPLLYCAHT